MIGFLSSLMDLDASARAHGALVRRRGVRSAADLLHLALLYGPGGLSLRSVASLATQAGIADLCDVSLLERLRRAPDWLADVLGHLLAERAGRRPAGGPRLALVDGSTISAPASTGSDWRLHARYEPAQGCFTDLSLTPAGTAEALCRIAVAPGDVLVQDRGYARVRDFGHAHAQGAHVITRIGWRSLVLRHPSGERFDLMAALPETLPETGAALCEHPVLIASAGTTMPARLVLARTPPGQALRQQARTRRKASRKGQRTDPRTLRAAGFMMLLTTLPPGQADAEAVIGLYRARWQVELAFKRLKSLGGLADLTARDPRLARTWLLAHLIAAVLVEGSLGEALDTPP